MKIVNDDDEDMVVFNDVEYGIVFIDEDGDIMMKIEPADDSRMSPNAVRLRDGSTYKFASHDQVMLRPHAFLTI